MELMWDKLKQNVQTVLNVFVLLIMFVVVLIVATGCSPNKPVAIDTSSTSVVTTSDTIYSAGKVTVKIEKEVKKDTIHNINKETINNVTDQIVDKVIGNLPINNKQSAKVNVDSLKGVIRKSMTDEFRRISKQLRVDAQYAYAIASYNNNQLNIELVQKESYITDIKDSLTRIIYKSVNSNTVRQTTIDNSANKSTAKYPKLNKLIDTLGSIVLWVIILIVVALIAKYMIKAFGKGVLAYLKNVWLDLWKFLLKKN